MPSPTDYRLTDRDLALLAHWPSLVGVYIGEDATAAALQYLRPSKDLKSLSFATHDSRGYDGHDIEALEGMEKLRSLTLWGRRISLDAMKHLGRLSSLDYLCFGGSDNSTPITDEGLACLGNLQRLDDLDLTGTKVTARGMKPLTTLKNLRRLALIDTRVREGDVRELARALPNLRFPALSGTCNPSATSATVVMLPSVSRSLRGWLPIMSG